jgi:hypothetical protein
MTHRRIWIWCAGVGLGGVFPALAMDLVEPLSLAVVWFHLLIGDWPGGRNPTIMLDLAEVFMAQPE